MKPLFTLSLLASVSCAQAGAVTVDQVLNAFVNSGGGGPRRATLSMTVLRPGQTTKTVMDVVSDGGRQSLVLVRSPAKLAGQAFLRVGEGMQFFNPAFGRALPMPPGAQGDGFLGSDFSLGDFTGGDFRSNFTAGKVVQTARTASLDLTTRPDAPIAFGKVNLTVNLPALTPQTMTFFDQRGQAVKKLSFAAFQTVNGQPFPTRLVMDDLLHRGDRTVLEYSNLKFGDVPAACFTPAAMQKGC